MEQTQQQEPVKEIPVKQVSAQDFLDALKPLNLGITKDAHERITVKKDKLVLTYVSDRKKGFSYSVKDSNIKWGWKAVNVKTKEEVDKAVEEIKKLIPA